MTLAPSTSIRPSRVARQVDRRRQLDAEAGRRAGGSRGRRAPGSRTSRANYADERIGQRRPAEERDHLAAADAAGRPACRDARRARARRRSRTRRRGRSTTSLPISSSAGRSISAATCGVGRRRGTGQ